MIVTHPGIGHSPANALMLLLEAPLGLIALAYPDTEAYSTLKANIEARRLLFQQTYASGDSASRAAIVDSARSYLFERITLAIIPSWYGTTWDYNGTTRIPGQGSIACGYFVNTVLQDAGFRLPRVKWSQLASEPVTVKVSHRVKRFRNRPVSEVEDYIVAQGDGLYKVGLDNHVGFIVKCGSEVSFVHSSFYGNATGVIREPLDGCNPLAHSRYRIVGSLLGDVMMEAWITGRDLATLP